MAESNDTAYPVSPLKLVKSSPVKAVESVNKENTKQLRSILARPIGEKAREKKTLRWAPDVVDPCTNKEEYMQRKLNAWLAQNELVEQEVSSYEEKENETSDKTSITSSITEPLEFGENSSLKDGDIQKEDSKQLRSILARPTGEKAKEKKKLRWAPDVVDPCTNKDEYWRRFLIDEEEVSSSDEKKNETSDKNIITSSITERREFVESSSVKDVKIVQKKDSNQLRSILARPAAEKAKEKKKLRWAPDVVDPCTNKDEYWRRFLIVPDNLAEEEISLEEEKKQ